MARLVQVELELRSEVVLVFLVAALLVQVGQGVRAQEALVERLVLVGYLWQMPVCMEVQVVPMPVDRTGMVQLLAALELVAQVAKGVVPVLLLAKVPDVRRTVCATQVTSRWAWTGWTAQRSANAIP